MLHSIYHFTPKNGRLNINELPKGPTIRYHNKLIGILLWLFGKTEVLEGLNVKNKKKVWFINKGSLENLKKAYAQEEGISIDKLIKYFIDQRNKNVERQNDEKPKGNGPNNKKEFFVKDFKEPVSEKQEKGKKDEDPQDLKREEFEFGHKPHVDDQKKAPIIPPKEPENLNLNRKETKIDFETLTKEEFESLLDSKKKNKNITFSFQKPPSLANYTAYINNGVTAEQFIELFSGQSNLLELLQDLCQKLEPMNNHTEDSRKLIEFYSQLLEECEKNDEAIGVLIKNDPEKLFNCFMSNKNAHRTTHITKLAQRSKDADTLYTFIKLVYEQRKELTNHTYKIFILALSAAGVFDEAFIKKLTVDQQNLLKEVILSQHSLSSLYLNIESPDLMNRLFKGGMQLLQINKFDPKLVEFIAKFSTNNLFAHFFLSFTQDQLKDIENCFANFEILPFIHEYDLRFEKDKPATKEYRQRLFYDILSRILQAYISQNNFPQIKEKISLLLKTFPWINLDIMSIRSNEHIVLPYFVAARVEKEIVNGKTSEEIRESVSKYFGLSGSDERNKLPHLLFSQVSEKKQDQVLEIFARYGEMVQKHLSLVIEKGNEKMMEAVFKTLFKNHKKIGSGYPGAFALMLPNIKNKEHLLLILKVIKELDIVNKNELLQGISGGVSYFNFGKDELYKVGLDNDEIQNAFKQMDLNYKEEPIDSITILRKADAIPQ